jgi:hypothetical protein
MGLITFVRSLIARNCIMEVILHFELMESDFLEFSVGMLDGERSDVPLFDMGTTVVTILFSSQVLYKMHDSDSIAQIALGSAGEVDYLIAHFLIISGDFCMRLRYRYSNMRGSPISPCWISHRRRRPGTSEYDRLPSAWPSPMKAFLSSPLLKWPRLPGNAMQ